MRENLMNWFLLALTLSDVGILLTSGAMLLLPVLVLGGRSARLTSAIAVLQRWAYPFGLFSQACSVHLLCAASAFRYLGVCRPFLVTSRHSTLRVPPSPEDLPPGEAAGDSGERGLRPGRRHRLRRPLLGPPGLRAHHQALRLRRLQPVGETAAKAPLNKGDVDLAGRA